MAGIISFSVGLDNRPLFYVPEWTNLDSNLSRKETHGRYISSVDVSTCSSEKSQNAKKHFLSSAHHNTLPMRLRSSRQMIFYDNISHLTSTGVANKKRVCGITQVSTISFFHSVEIILKLLLVFEELRQHNSYRGQSGLGNLVKKADKSI